MMRHKGVILGALLLCMGWLLWRQQHEDYNTPISPEWGGDSPDNIDYETFRQTMHDRTAHMEAAQRNRRNAKSER